MDVCVLTANTGSFEEQVPYVEQSVPYDFYSFDDTNFPPRVNALTPRLQARIVKMFAHQMVPDHSVYIWLDSSMTMSHKDAISWFIEKLGTAQMAVFKHPNRNTIGEEADYLKKRLDMGCDYITPRYENELIDEQMAEIDDPDMPLYATTAFVYRPNLHVKLALKEWWYHTSRYHSVDQLSLAYALDKYSGYFDVNVITENLFKSPYLSHTRK